MLTIDLQQISPSHHKLPAPLRLLCFTIIVSQTIDRDEEEPRPANEQIESKRTSVGEQTKSVR